MHNGTEDTAEMRTPKSPAVLTVLTQGYHAGWKEQQNNRLAIGISVERRQSWSKEGNRLRWFQNDRRVTHRHLWHHNHVAHRSHHEAEHGILTLNPGNSYQNHPHITDRETEGQKD